MNDNCILTVGSVTEGYHPDKLRGTVPLAEACRKSAAGTFTR